ncbi:hypothetical protein D3C85_1162140 [compost metagenome]
MNSLHSQSIQHWFHSQFLYLSERLRYFCAVALFSASQVVPLAALAVDAHVVLASPEALAFLAVALAVDLFVGLAARIECQVDSCIVSLVVQLALAD